MEPLSCRALKTRIFAAGNDLAEFIISSVPANLITERMILAVTSKIVSVAEGRLIAQASTTRAELIKSEADVFLGPIAHGCNLTIKHGLFIVSAGIDESNSAHGDYIVYPEDPVASARGLWHVLREHWGVRELGIILTDSRTQPLRRGVVGVALAYWGFAAIKNMIGERDLFGRALKQTQVNVVDALAGVAVLSMGEGAESQPLALLHHTQVMFDEMSDRETLIVDPADDLYAPFFKNVHPKPE